MKWREVMTDLIRLTMQARNADRAKPDHGDVGTAFGLDASFGSAQSSAGPVDSPPSRAQRDRARHL